MSCAYVPLQGTGWGLISTEIYGDSMSNFHCRDWYYCLLLIDLLVLVMKTVPRTISGVFFYYFHKFIKPILFWLVYEAG